MNNLYHKIAVVSFSIGLSLALGANKEAKAATIILTPTEKFLVSDRNSDGQGDNLYGGISLPVGIKVDLGYGEYFREEYKAFYEFNIANLSLNSNTIIRSAIFDAKIKSIERYGSSSSTLNVIGYVGNGTAEVSDFTQKGLFSNSNSYSISIHSLSPGSNFQFNITEFIKQMVNNREPFAGVGFNSTAPGSVSSGDPGYLTIESSSPTLTIITEPVPEPTTIFGSAIGLFLGGWLKRKNSDRQSKTTPRH